MVDGDRGDGGVAAQAADGLDGEWLAVTGLTHRVLMGAVTHRAGIGEQRQIGGAVPVVRAPVINPTRASALR